jgi:hypothetical protein
MSEVTSSPSTETIDPPARLEWDHRGIERNYCLNDK